MSTVQECLESGLLVRVKGNLGPRQVAQRLLVARPEAVDWMRSNLPNLQSDGYVTGAARPIEQAAVLFKRFVSGESFAAPLPHEMTPFGHGIWRLRTPDLRFDGWFPQRGCFLIFSAGTKKDTSESGKSDEIVRLAQDYRKGLGLNYVEGDTIDGLV